MTGEKMIYTLKKESLKNITKPELFTEQYLN